MTCPFGEHEIHDWYEQDVIRIGKRWSCSPRPGGERGTVCVRCHKTWREDGSPTTCDAP